MESAVIKVSATESLAACKASEMGLACLDWDEQFEGNLLLIRGSWQEQMYGGRSSSVVG